MPDCPPTYALYKPAYVLALRQHCPVWLWTLRRLQRLYHRQALIWLQLELLAMRWFEMNLQPRMAIALLNHEEV